MFVELLFSRTADFYKLDPDNAELNSTLPIKVKLLFTYKQIYPDINVTTATCSFSVM
jgi:hypothetical protein